MADDANTVQHCQLGFYEYLYAAVLAEGKFGMTQMPEGSSGTLSVIIAARNEEGYITACLDAVLAQDMTAGAVEVIVSANACTDTTVATARAKSADYEERDWQLTVLDLPDGGKIGALNAADAAASGAIHIYLDADVICSPALFGQLRDALSADRPLYGTGTLEVAKAETWVTRAYASIWTQLPFVKGGAVGAGLFAVNAAGRKHWDAFPDIISDDTYVRMQFSPDERIEVPATYRWPMVEGFSNLVRVRRRQDAGVHELHERYPEIIANEGKDKLGKSDLIKLALTRPIGFAVYVAVHVSVRMKQSSSDWTRGR